MSSLSRPRLPFALRILGWVALIWLVFGFLFVGGAWLTHDYGLGPSEEPVPLLWGVHFLTFFFEFVLLLLAGGLTFVRWLRREIEG